MPKTDSEISQDIIDYLPNNTSRQITPAGLRIVVNDLNDNKRNKSDRNNDLGTSNADFYIGSETTKIRINTDAGVFEYTTDGGTTWIEVGSGSSESVASQTPVRLCSVEVPRQYADLDIYTCPEGKIVYPIYAIVKCLEATGTTSPAQISLGRNSLSTEVFPQTTLTGLTITDKFFRWMPEGGSRVINAGDIIKLTTHTVGDGSAYKLKIDLFGVIDNEVTPPPPTGDSITFNGTDLILINDTDTLLYQ